MTERWVRGRHEKVRILPSAITGERIQQCKKWRETESTAGRPSELADYFLAHGICPRCYGEGVEIVDWIKPRIDEETEYKGVSPLYDVCSLCSGSGKGAATS